MKTTRIPGPCPRRCRRRRPPRPGAGRGPGRHQGQRQRQLQVRLPVPGLGRLDAERRRRAATPRTSSSGARASSMGGQVAKDVTFFFQTDSGNLGKVTERREGDEHRVRHPGRLGLLEARRRVHPRRGALPRPAQPEHPPVDAQLLHARHQPHVHRHGRPDADGRPARHRRSRPRDTSSTAAASSTAPPSCRAFATPPRGTRSGRRATSSTTSSRRRRGTSSPARTSARRRSSTSTAASTCRRTTRPTAATSSPRSRSPRATRSAARSSGSTTTAATFLTTIPKQDDLLVEAAYYLSKAKVQPFLKYESQKFAYDVDKAKDQERFGGGLNYYVSGQNFKITAQYLRVEPKSSALKSTDQFTVQIQAFYF